MIQIRKLIHSGRAQINRVRLFRCQGRLYRYCTDSYNESWDNERAVEIPLFRRMVADARRQNASILEIGNVLAHYGRITWQAVDKYEKDAHVICCDVADVIFKERYDLIVSISTFEHVGFDENMRNFPEQWDESKLLIVLSKIVQHGLKGNGRLVASFPLGYNAKLDGLLFDGGLGERDAYFMKRVSLSNRWRQVTRNDVREVRYGSPFNSGNAICVAEFVAAPP